VRDLIQGIVCKGVERLKEQKEGGIICRDVKAPEASRLAFYEPIPVTGKL
jgi:hypothetical protein